MHDAVPPPLLIGHPDPAIGPLVWSHSNARSDGSRVGSDAGRVKALGFGCLGPCAAFVAGSFVALFMRSAGGWAAAGLGFAVALAAWFLTAQIFVRIKAREDRPWTIHVGANGFDVWELVGAEPRRIRAVLFDEIATARYERTRRFVNGVYVRTEERLSFEGVHGRQVVVLSSDYREGFGASSDALAIARIAAETAARGIVVEDVFGTPLAGELADRSAE